MKFLLDSPAVMALLGGHALFLLKLKRHRPADFGIAAIAAHRLYYGACKSRRAAEHLAQIEALQFPVVEFDREDARQAGAVAAALAKAGAPLGPHDVLVAGQALARQLTLVTRDVRQFERIPGLQVEDWETV